MAAKNVDVKGELSGLVRKVGKSGSESWTFTLTGDDMQSWERLKLFHRERVEITITAAQDELALEGEKTGKGRRGEDLPRGVKKGSTAATPSHQAQD